MLLAYYSTKQLLHLLFDDGAVLLLGLNCKYNRRITIIINVVAINLISTHAAGAPTFNSNNSYTTGPQGTTR